MNINFTWKHIDHSDAAEAHARDKVQKLEIYLHKIISCDVSFELIRGEENAIINLNADGSTFSAHNTEKDIYTCIDGMIAKMDHQLGKFHDKKTSH